MSDLYFLDVDDLIEIHDSILANGAGLAGVHFEKLEAVVGRVDNQTLYGQIDNAFELAAHYGEAIARGHAFVDANKRTAFVAMFSVLHNNGFPVPDDQSFMDYYNSDSFIADTIVKVAIGKISAKQLSEILALGYLTVGAVYAISDIASLFKK